MKKKFFLCLLSLGISSLIFLYPLSCAWAGIRIDKPKIRLTISSGSYDGGEIKVENTGEEPITVKAYLEDWVYTKQDGGKEFMPKGTTPMSCSNWITFYPADFTLKPGTSQMVRYTVSVPADAKGGHYSVMFFETGGGETEEVNEKGNTVTIKILNRLGALFYVEPEGTTQKTADLKNINISQKLNNLIVTADFLNTGSADIKVKGSLDILDEAGYVYARGTFDEAYTLPQDKAFLQSKVSSANLKTGSYDMIMTLEFENGGTLVKEILFTVSADGNIGSITPK